MNFSTNFAWIKFEHPIFNASWPICTIMEELEWLWKSNSSAIMMKTCTLEERNWNPKPRYIELNLGSINSMWLPNLGYKKYIEFWNQLKKRFNKPVIASVAGLKPKHFPIMVKAFQKNSNVDLIEINLSCPNVPWKPQIAYDFEASDKILSKVENLWSKPIWIKLPPYFDLIHIEQMSEIIKKYNISFITCINSVGNTLFINPEKEEVVIKPKWWFWWLGWDYVKPIALANVRKFYELLWNNIDISWVWWIKSWEDVFEFILAWAKTIQLATIYAKEGYKCFERINKEFIEYITKKGYNEIEDFRWKLKTL